MKPIIPINSLLAKAESRMDLMYESGDGYPKDAPLWYALESIACSQIAIAKMMAEQRQPAQAGKRVMVEYDGITVFAKDEDMLLHLIGNFGVIFDEGRVIAMHFWNTCKPGNWTDIEDVRLFCATEQI